jgi:hypothetical protein
MDVDAAALIEGRVLAVGDLGIDVRLPDQQRAEAAAHLFAGMEPFEGPSSIELRWQDGDLALPDREPDLSGYGLDIWHEDGAVLVQHRAVTARASGGRLLVAGSAEASPAAWLDFRRVFEPALTHLLAPFQRFMLHGAAIARGGTAIYVAGDTGRGKSTLAWAAYQSGWDLLADDYVLVRRAEGGYEVAGLRKPVAVPGELFEEPPEGARRLERAGRRRWELPASILTPGWFRLGAVLFPAHGDGEAAELDAVSGHEMVPNLLGAFVASADQQALRDWFPHAAALGRLPLWELRHARPERARLAAAARCLEQLVPA